MSYPKLEIHEFTVTRQSRWEDGLNIVEISQGGIDYANPDALVGMYRGEFETFQGMVAAVDAAIGIAKQWDNDTDEVIHIAIGCTHGMTATFEEQEISEEVFEELREKATEFDAKLPHCVQCGELLGSERYGNYDFDEFDCCSEYCAEKYYAPIEEDADETV